VEGRGVWAYGFAGGGFPGPKSETWAMRPVLWADVDNPPAHRDSAAMNGAQLLMAYGDSSGLMSGPPAEKATTDCLVRLSQGCQQRV
jgi:hypothetical protein